jgi:hypothetical protein
MQDLIQAIRDRKAILFVGAGLSMNLGLPSFRKLIDHLADELDFDRELFHLSGDYLSLAEYYYLTQGAIGPLRSWMDTTWHNSEVDISKSSIHKVVVELNFPIIYTTNYDNWLEKAFKHYNSRYIKIANVADIARAQEGIPQIVKLHGDFDSDDSIVLTESSYFERMSFESPLDIKLRSDVLGKTILFLGYSLSDVNIRYLLYKLQKQWQATEFEKARPKSYIYLTKPNMVQEKILHSRGIEPIVCEIDDPKEGLSDFLSKLLHAALG